MQKRCNDAAAQMRTGRRRMYKPDIQLWLLSEKSLINSTMKALTLARIKYTQ